MLDKHLRTDGLSLVEHDARSRRVVERIIPATGPLTGEQEQSVIAALRRHMKESGLSATDVARSTGTRSDVINSLLSNACNVADEARFAIIRVLDAWLTRESRAKAGRSKPAGLVSTKITEREIAVIQRATEHHDMFVVVGASGIGKSTIADAAVEMIPGVYKVTADRDSRSATGLLKAIYRSVAGRRGPKTIYLADVVDLLRKPRGVASFPVLIVDDTHKVADRAMAMLPEIHDAAECSIVLIGTLDLLKRVQSDTDIMFGQLSSRIGLRVTLDPELFGMHPGGRGAQCFTTSDIRAMFERGKLRLHPDATRMLVSIANGFRGCLRRVARIVGWAIVAAKRDGADVISAAHVQAAMAVVEQDRQAGRELQSEVAGTMEATA